MQRSITFEEQLEKRNQKLEEEFRVKELEKLNELCFALITLLKTTTLKEINGYYNTFKKLFYTTVINDLGLVSKFEFIITEATALEIDVSKLQRALSKLQEIYLNANFSVNIDLDTYLYDEIIIPLWEFQTQVKLIHENIIKQEDEKTEEKEIIEIETTKLPEEEQEKIEEKEIIKVEEIKLSEEEKKKREEEDEIEKEITEILSLPLPINIFQEIISFCDIHSLLLLQTTNNYLNKYFSKLISLNLNLLNPEYVLNLMLKMTPKEILFFTQKYFRPVTCDLYQNLQTHLPKTTDELKTEKDYQYLLCYALLTSDIYEIELIDELYGELIRRKNLGDNQYQKYLPCIMSIKAIFDYDIHLIKAACAKNFKQKTSDQDNFLNFSGAQIQHYLFIVPPIRDFFSTKQDYFYDLRYCNLEDTKWEKATLAYFRFDHANLINANFQQIVFKYCNFSHANCISSKFYHSIFHKNNFNHTNLENASISFISSYAKSCGAAHLSGEPNIQEERIPISSLLNFNECNLTNFISYNNRLKYFQFNNCNMNNISLLNQQILLDESSFLNDLNFFDEDINDPKFSLDDRNNIRCIIATNIKKYVKEYVIKECSNLNNITSYLDNLNIALKHPFFVENTFFEKCEIAVSSFAQSMFSKSNSQLDESHEIEKSQLSPSQQIIFSCIKLLEKRKALLEEKRVEFNRAFKP